MERWIQEPHLPKGPASLILCQENGRVADSLYQYGIQTIPVPACDGIGTPLRSHADLQVLPLGNADLLVASNAAPLLKRALRSAGASLVESCRPIGSVYPSDVRLNFALLGGRLIGKADAIDPMLKEVQRQKDWMTVPVRQGYGKCSIAILDHNSIVTSDPGIAQTCRSLPMDVLQIRPGFICLEGYDSGLIGGTCGKLSHNKLAFCGNIMTHPDGARMVHFLEIHSMEPICLWNGELTDVGSLIPLKEYAKERDSI